MDIQERVRRVCRDAFGYDACELSVLKLVLEYAKEQSELPERCENQLALKVWWEYDEGGSLYLFWDSPYGNGKEKIATFWWPTHPPEVTAEVEQLFERIAARAAL